jgi:hypothetical protein
LIQAYGEKIAAPSERTCLVASAANILLTLAAIGVIFARVFRLQRRGTREGKRSPMEEPTRKKNPSGKTALALEAP